MIEFKRRAGRAAGEPHADGEAVCMACKHRWEAVAPYPVTTLLECPACTAMKGTYVNYFEPADDQVWTCGCGNQLFFLTHDSWHCPNCGTEQEFS